MHNLYVIYTPFGTTGNTIGSRIRDEVSQTEGGDNISISVELSYLECLAQWLALSSTFFGQ